MSVTTQLKHCSGHATHFPSESVNRLITDFNKYYGGLQPQCRRCNEKAMAARAKGADGGLLANDESGAWIRTKMQKKYPDVTDNHTGTVTRKRMIQSHVEKGYVLETTTWEQLLKHHGIKARAQSGTPAGKKTKPMKRRKTHKPKVYESINDMPALRRSEGRKGSNTKKGLSGTTRRKGHGPTLVNNRHNDDQNILVGIYGKRNVRVEEDFYDILVRGRIPEIIEYKPDVDRGDIHEALGKLWTAPIEYNRKHNITPNIRFMTRRKLCVEDIELFTRMGAKVSYLTKDNKVVPA